jgi:hypothetical protein
MRYAFLLLPLLFPLAAQAQVKTTPLASTSVPTHLKRMGKVKQALRYTDRTGTYAVLTSETGPVPAANPDDGQRADLYAYQYQVPATGAPTLSWQVHDFVPDCPLDLEAQFLPGSLTVTDLDQNGTAEVWMVYRTTCRGDVSPSTQKIIMREGAKKYAVRGNSRIQVGAKQYDGGDYQFDAAFKAAPVAFRQQATKLWQRYMSEKLE